MKLLNCILTYNRYYYLKNTVESLTEFFRFGDLLVVDDGSNDPKVAEYLSQLEHHGIHVIRQTHWQDQSFYGGHPFGGLHENMDVAVQFCISHGYDFIHFIHDDVQFMWHDPELLAKVKRVFEAFPDATQVVNIFCKGITRKESRRRWEPRPEANCYFLSPFGMGDMGIIPVALLKEHSFRFGNGNEKLNSSWWRRRGYKAYALHSPTLTLVPSPSVVRDSRQVEEGTRPVHKYYLKPLGAHQVERLRTRPLEELPVDEDYCLPWGWSCPRPYRYTADLGQYKRLRKLTRPLVPRRLRSAIRAFVKELKTSDY